MCSPDQGFYQSLQPRREARPTLKVHEATYKPHRCDECGCRIPIGARYFSGNNGARREHTNCLLYEREPILPEGYNQNRAISRGSV